MNKVNELSAKEGKARRADLLKRYKALKKQNIKGVQRILSEEEGISKQRISWLLAKALKD